jgi:diacylglycerol O-acyltransferase / wax synthase
MAARELLTPLDTAWLRMDRPTNLMHICGMMIFADRVDPAALKEVVRSRMLCFHRFRQRVVDRDTQPAWQEDPGFDLDWHVRHIRASGDAELADMLGGLMSTPLDSSKPMWQFHLVDLDDGGSAVILRIHHCYGDGFALMHVLDTMTDADPAAPRLPVGDLVATEGQRGAWERVLGPVAEGVGDAWRLAERAVETGFDLMTHPSHAMAWGMAGYGLLQDSAIIAAMRPDAPTRFKGALGVMKRVAWAAPLSLFEVKAVGDAFGCSVNDVLLACTAGAMRAYLQAQGDEVDNLDVRALVPVNCRPAGPVNELGNRFGLVFLSLPVGVANPFDRMMEVRRRMEELKRSQQPTVALGILAGMGLFPEMVKERVLESLAANASVVITNVRGASRPQFLAGRRIERQVFWVPQSGGIGMGVSILSYAGNVDIGVVTDTKRVPDPGQLVKHLTEEFEMLLLCAMLAPSVRSKPALPRERRQKAQRMHGKGASIAHHAPNHRPA